MIRTWQNRMLRLSNRSDDRVSVRCHFDDEPGTLDTFYANIFRLVEEEHIELDQAANAMKRLLLFNLWG
jgi:hypothetical protein